MSSSAGLDVHKVYRAEVNGAPVRIMRKRSRALNFAVDHKRIVGIMAENERDT